jgi:hypothetical protein
MKLTTSFLLCILVWACCFSCKHSSLDKEEENEQDGMLQAMRQEFLMTRDPRTNEIPTERLLPTFRELRKAQMSSREGALVLNWSERGPNNIGGRTRAILYDMNDAVNGYKKVWAGSVGGGLWYTNDITAATPVWNKINDFLSNLAITTIAQSPFNTQYLYAGTGEGWFNVDAIRGLGIFRSIDGGSSWSQLSSTNNIGFYNVQKIAVTSTGTVFACTRAAGLQRSTDNGTTWTKVLGNGTGGGLSDRAADVEIGGDGIIYCSIGIFSSDGVYRSTDNGGTWTKIYTSASDEKRIELACAPGNANYMYALVHQSTGSADGLKKIMYTSNATGGSVTWTSPANPTSCNQGSAITDFTNGQAWYDLAAAVDPNNENNAFIGGLDVLKTVNGGAAWTQVSQWASGCSSLPYVHADIHTIVFKPGSSSEFLVGCDGGIFRTTNSGTSFVDRNSSYNVTQYYSVALNPTSGSNYMLAGAQDNGSHKFSSGGINSINTVTGGDGAYCFISQTNSNYQLTSYVYSRFYRSTNGGSSFATVINNASGRFINPAELDQNNILYFGNLDGSYGNYDLITGGSPNYIDLTSSATLTNLQVSAIKADPNANYVIYCAFSTSETSGSSIVPKLLKVINANGSTTGPPAQRPSATEITLPAFAAGSYISSIDVEAGNSNHILLTLSNYGVTSVWESTNSGSSWNNIEGNLPDMPVRWGMFIPSGYGYKIMLATELGVWTTSAINGTSTVWAADNSGLANVRVDMLRLRSGDKTMAAATHGRGVFTTVLSTALPVTLADFDAQLKQATVQLSWTTSFEQELKLFEVQKSTDGTNFHTIGKLNAAGGGPSNQNYSLTDLQISESNYYRLKMIEEDGNFTYSKIVFIKNSSIKQNIWVINNPISNYIDLKLAKQAQSVKLQLIAMNGVVVSEKVWYSPSSEIHWQIHNYLSRGTYLLRVITDNHIFTKKLIKE